MSDQRFERAVRQVLEHEGGLVNDPNDPGGITKFGISQRSYPDLDIAHLSEAEAIEIYRRDWWERYHYAALPAPIGEIVFDFAVNSGPTAAHRWLQRALHAAGEDIFDDGVLGIATIAACYKIERLELIALYRLAREAHYRALIAAKPGEAKFLTGWLNRIYGEEE